MSSTASRPSWKPCASSPTRWPPTSPGSNTPACRLPRGAGGRDAAGDGHCLPGAWAARVRDVHPAAGLTRASARHSPKTWAELRGRRGPVQRRLPAKARTRAATVQVLRRSRQLSATGIERLHGLPRSRRLTTPAGEDHGSCPTLGPTLALPFSAIHLRVHSTASIPRSQMQLARKIMPSMRPSRSQRRPSEH